MKLCRKLRAFAQEITGSCKRAPIFLKQKQWSATSMPRQNRGKFWPVVRELIMDKAQELYQMDQARAMDGDFKGVTAERSELKEGGYLHEAKLIVLRNLWLEKKGLPGIEMEEMMDACYFEAGVSEATCWVSIGLM
jgi:hypothetical protein